MKIIQIILLVIITFNLSAQTEKFETFKIGKWTLEFFPTHYYKKPFKIYSEKNRVTGQLNFYQEINEFGKPDGLTVGIQKSDNISPAYVDYYVNGQVVYSAEFFNHSEKAFKIINKNVKGELNGIQIQREFNTNNKLNEILEKYKNDELLSTNKPDNSPKANFINGYLDGFFRFEQYPDKFEGYAKEGEITSLKRDYFGDITEYKIKGDSIIKSYIIKGKQLSPEILKKESTLFVTNEPLLKNAQRHFYVENLQDIENALYKMEENTIYEGPDTLNFINNELAGYFSFVKIINDQNCQRILGNYKDNKLDSLVIKNYTYDKTKNQLNFLYKNIFYFKGDSMFTFLKQKNEELKPGNVYKISKTIHIVDFPDKRPKEDEQFMYIYDISLERLKYLIH